MEIPRGSRLLSLAQVRLAPALERALKSAWGVRVQRLGAQALRRVAARFPVLSELVSVRAPGQRQVEVSHASRRESARDAGLDAPLLPAATLRVQLAHAPTWEARARAAVALSRADADDAVEPLLAALQDPCAEVAAAAIDSLCKFREPRVTSALESVLLNREGYFNPITRAAAVIGLARGASATQFGPVVNALSDLDAEVSLAAIAALGEFAPELTARHLLPIVDDRSGFFLPFVRLAATRALVRAGALERETAARLRRVEQDSAVRAELEAVVAGGVSA